MTPSEALETLWQGLKDYCYCSDAYADAYSVLEASVGTGWLETNDGDIDQEQADAIIGRDLWICYLTPGENEHVVRGYYLSGRLANGFFRESGDGQPLKRVTHYWVRDPRPRSPSKMEEG